MLFCDWPWLQLATGLHLVALGAAWHGRTRESNYGYPYT